MDNLMSQQSLYALLIGINHYASAAVPDLRGCVNDVEAMAALLHSQYGVPSANIVILTNEQATHAAIASAFQTHLTTPSHAWHHGGQQGEMPAVLFYFSGHGSRALAETRETASGFDETLVPHDSRTNNVYDIKDWELKDWLNGVTPYTENVTVILDCCHSGSGTRLTEKRTTDIRGCDDDRRPQPPRIVTRSGGNWVALSACRNDQQAHEAPVEETTALHGVFTHWLLETLAHMSPHRPLTYRELYEQLVYRVGKSHPTQTPQCDGNRDRLWLAGAYAPQARWLSLLPPREGLVWVNAGQMHGLVVGTRLAVYPSGTAAGEEASGDPLAILEIDTVEATQSGCVRIDAQTDVEIPAGARVIVDWQSAALQRTRVALVDLNEGLSKIIRERLLQSDCNPWLSAVLAEEACALRLRQTGDQVELQNRVGQVIQRYELRKLNPFRGGWGKPAYYDPIVKDLLHIVQYEKLVALQNLGSAEITEAIALSAETIMDQSSPLRGSLAVGATNLRLEGQETVVLPEGAGLVLAITNRHSLPLYLTVLRLDADFGVTRLWPMVAGLHEALAPGHKLTLGRPTAGAAPIVVHLPPGAASRSETFKIFASLDETDFDYFYQSKLPSQAPSALPSPPPTANQGPVMRAYKLGGSALPADRWGAVEFRVNVMRAAVN